MLGKIKKILTPETCIHFLAWQLFDKGLFKLAVPIWKLAELLKLRLCSSYDGLCRSYCELKNEALALNYFDRLLNTPKHNSNDWLHLKEAALILGNNQQALQALKAAWQNFPTDNQIFEELLNELTRQKLNHEILELIQKIKAWRQDIGTIGLVWQAYYNLNDFSASQTWLEENKFRLTDQIYSDLSFRTVTKGLRYALKNEFDLDKAYRFALEVPVSQANIGSFRLITIHLVNAKRFNEASIIIKKMLQHGIPEQLYATAAITLGYSGEYDAAHTVIRNSNLTNAEKYLLRGYLSQLKEQPKELEYIINELLAEGQFTPIKNFSGGINNIELTAQPKAPTLRTATPLVTIIMTCFNDAKFLRRAVNSIIAQVINNFELLIVDDASTDDTYAIACELAKLDSRIKAFKNSTNSGPYFSKNSMLNIATGKYLAFHDADDISHPQRLIRQIEAIESDLSNSTFATMCYHLRICEETGKLVERGFNLLTESPISLVFPREQFLRIFGAFDTIRAGADSELIRRIQAHLGKSAICLIPYPLYYASYRAGSLTTDSKIGLSQSGELSVRDHYRQLTDQYHQQIKLGHASAYRKFPEPNMPFTIPDELKIDPSSFDCLNSSAT